MRHLKRHILILLLAVFIVGSSAGLVMAHCGHEGFSSDDGATIDIGVKVEKECASHEHGLASIEDGDALQDAGQAASPLDCNDCSGVTCHSQSQLPEGAVSDKCVETDNIHSKNNIKIKPIYHTIIPDPPKQLV